MWWKSCLTTKIYHLVLHYYSIIKDFKLWSFSLPLISSFHITFSIFSFLFQWLLQSAQRSRWLTSLTQRKAPGTEAPHGIEAMSWQGEPTALPGSMVSPKPCTKLPPLSSGHISCCNSICITNRCSDAFIQWMGHRPRWLSLEDIGHGLLPSTEGRGQQPALLSADLPVLSGSTERSLLLLWPLQKMT